jgi:cytochrome P450
MVLRTKFLSNPWLPKKFKQVLKACESFQAYLTQLYEGGKRSYADGALSDRNMMTSLVRECAAEAKTSNGLTESEIYGNMFFLNFAGHDTTTHSLMFAIMYLAVSPAVQEWISEEMNFVFGNRLTEQWYYEADILQLKRCLSVLMETSRLYTHVPVAGGRTTTANY